MLFELNFLGKSNFQEKLSERFKGQGLWGSFLLGVVFALAFCPYSGALYFGMLIPMTISSASGLYLPIVFAIGTGLPVILFTYLLAFAAHRVGGVFNKITKSRKSDALCCRCRICFSRDLLCEYFCRFYLIGGLVVSTIMFVNPSFNTICQSHVDVVPFQ